MKTKPILTLYALYFVVMTACSSNSAPPEEVNLIRNKAADFTKFGNQYYEQAQFDQALSFFQLALQNNILIDNQAGSAASLNSIGKSYMAKGDDASAEQAYLEAQDMGNQLKSSELLLQATNNLAEIKFLRGATEEAIQDLTQAIRGKETLQTREMAVLYHTLGSAYRKKAVALSKTENTPEAQNYFTLALTQINKAAEINQQLKLYQELASNLYMSASVQSHLGDYGKAQETALLALSNDRKMENSLGIAQDLRLLGDISSRTGENKAAFEYHFRAYRIFQALQLKPQEARSLDLMIPLLESLGMSSDAQTYRSLRQEISVQSPPQTP